MPGPILIMLAVAHVILSEGKMSFEDAFKRAVDEFILTVEQAGPESGSWFNTAYYSGA